MELDKPVFHLMRRVMQEHAAYWQTHLPRLTKVQYAVLSETERTPGIEQSQLGHHAAIDKATLASLLTRMEQRGLISRTVDPADRRRRLVELTDQGRTELRASAPVAEAVDSELLDRISDSERRELHRILGKMSAD
ncbi:DNA-binding transcriptional regulator, MarR family [Actinopolyspora xinjiangensis]|uniref:DNA-binding transcriptional regulator, MarR family n=1 Tax=Actinopolyspora xinjiangensis TaxID=405564 RepID=A0A1H0VAR3_9ACTN|nr:MarR family winged helix-turn-helix transcriptional regulator [Actinopolyspora xinjiangensis]SDP75649.1 DNA-binding transcriptional regulator, MarR family [Actinopolyspora xinjiangensis]